MRQLCRRLTREFFQPGGRALLLLEGEPGAGKTTFCQGFKAALEIPENINSPTFNILNEYHGKIGDLYHYDLYRLHGPEEFLDLDFLERWNAAWPGQSGRTQIHAVEWWRRAERFFPFALPTFLFSIESVAARPAADGDDETREVRLWKLASSPATAP